VTPDLVVAGAGMAGLAAAAHARELGASVRHLEAAPAPGGAMRYSSGVLWRHRDWDDFRSECPGGDEALQRALFERLDGDLDWLEARGARVTAPETGNPRTVGRRFVGVDRPVAHRPADGRLDPLVTTFRRAFTRLPPSRSPRFRTPGPRGRRAAACPTST